MTTEQGCRIGMFTTSHFNENNMFYKPVKQFEEEFLPSHLNCSIVYIPALDIGESAVNETGHYDNNTFYGALQDNRINILFYVSNLKSFKNPSAFAIDVPLFEAEANLINAVAKVNQSDIDVLQTFHTVDLNTYYFMAIATFLTISWLHLIMSWSFWKSLWVSMTGMVGQINDDGDTTSERVIWVHFLFFILFAINGILGGLISADMTMSWKSRRIESLEDIINFNATPVYYKQSCIQNWLENSAEESVERKVMERAEERGSALLIPMAIKGLDITESSAISEKFLNSLCNPNEAFLEYDILIKPLLRFACIGRDIKEPIFAQGTQSFGKDIFVIPYSSRLPEETRRNTSRHLRRLSEAGLFHILLDKLLSRQFRMSFPFQETSEHRRCSSLDFFREKEMFEKLHPTAPPSLTMKLFHGPLDLLCILFIVCILVLIMELIVFYILLFLFH